MQKFSTQQKTIAFCIVVVLVLINFIFVPFFHKRAAIRVVQDVLKIWKKGDLSLAFAYWENEDDSPPVYGVADYKILNKIFDKKDGKRHAVITAFLEFSNSNILPSGDWVFELRKTKYGWKIIGFHLEK